MASKLVPFIQDTKKWTDHYLKQARKQTKSKELTRQFEEKSIKINLVAPTSQLARQVQSEIKEEKKSGRDFELIKVTPNFDSDSERPAVKETSSKSNPVKRLRKSQSKPAKKPKVRDIFNN